MIEKIKEVYERINKTMVPFGIMNSKKFRTNFKIQLENEILNSVIKCDEENNPSDVVDLCCLVAKVSWTENHQNKYCILIFGHPEQVMILQQKLLI